MTADAVGLAVSATVTEMILLIAVAALVCVWISRRPILPFQLGPLNDASNISADGLFPDDIGICRIERRQGIGEIVDAFARSVIRGSVERLEAGEQRVGVDQKLSSRKAPAGAGEVVGEFERRDDVLPHRRKGNRPWLAGHRIIKRAVLVGAVVPVVRDVRAGFRPLQIVDPRIDVTEYAAIDRISGVELGPGNACP